VSLPDCDGTYVRVARSGRPSFRLDYQLNRRRKIVSPPAVFAAHHLLRRDAGGADFREERTKARLFDQFSSTRIFGFISARTMSVSSVEGKIDRGPNLRGKLP